jgi:hypothetical protein
MAGRMVDWMVEMKVGRKAVTMVVQKAQTWVAPMVEQRVVRRAVS